VSTKWKSRLPMMPSLALLGIWNQQFTLTGCDPTQQLQRSVSQLAELLRRPQKE
jgi:hypothetical protein